MNDLKSGASVNKVKELPQKKEEQFFYLNRWVNKAGFRAFVYGKDDTQQLANSHKEFQALIESGLWFASKEEVPIAEVTPIKKGVKKNGTDSR